MHPTIEYYLRYVLVFKIRLDLQSSRLVDRDLKFCHPIILNPEFIMNIGWRKSFEEKEVVNGHPRLQADRDSITVTLTFAPIRARGFRREWGVQ